MSKFFYTPEERDAFIEGKRDEQNKRSNDTYDYRSDNDVDRAYFEGRKEMQEDEYRREEEEQQLLMLQEETRMYDENRRLMEDEYEMYLREQEMGALHGLEQLAAQINEDLLELEGNPQPLTEEELFMEIEEDERKDWDKN